MVEYFGEHIKYPKKLSDMSQNYKNHLVSTILISKIQGTQVKYYFMVVMSLNVELPKSNHNSPPPSSPV